MKQIYIVTGASGYLGRSICLYLLKYGFTVRSLVRSEKSAKNIPAGVELISGNILDPVSLDKLFYVSPGEEAEFIVIHSAAQISVKKHDEKAFVVNYEGTKNIVRACIENNAKRLVYIGSVDALYNPDDGSVITEPDRFHLDRPDTDYALSKCMASQYVLDASKDKLDAIILMPSCVLGPGDYRGGFVSLMFEFYISGMPPVALSGGYDFVDCRDFAKYTLKAAQEAKRGSVYIFSGHYMSTRDIFDTLATYMGKKKTKKLISGNAVLAMSPALNLALRFMKKDPMVTRASLWLLSSEAVFSHERAAKELGYKPRPIEETIRDTYLFTAKKMCRQKNGE